MLYLYVFNKLIVIIDTLTLFDHSKCFYIYNYKIILFNNIIEYTIIKFLL